MQVKFSSQAQTGDLGVRSKGQMSLNFDYHINSKILYQTLCAFLQIKDRKHIEQNFHSVAGVMPQGWDLGVLGGSKTLAWGFAMPPHRLRILVTFLLPFEETQHFNYLHFLMQIIEQSHDQTHAVWWTNVDFSQ